MSLETLAQLMTAQAAIGNALTVPQQIFVSANYKKFAEYLNSDDGRTAVRKFVDDWQHSVEPPKPKSAELVTAAVAASTAPDTAKSFDSKPISYKGKL